MTGLVLDDQSTEVDALDFQLYATSLTKVIRSSNTGTPLTIGVLGASGSGKTSLMKMIGNQLSEVFPIIWFDAWKYEHEDQMWQAMLIHVLNAFRETHHGDLKDYRQIQTALYELEAYVSRSSSANQLDQINFQLDEHQQRQNASLQFGWNADLTSGKALSRLLDEGKKSQFPENLLRLFSLVERQRQRNFREQVETHEAFTRGFAKLVHVSVSDLNARLVVFIDNLDRCRPEKALQVLDAVDKYLNVPGCIFVIGANPELFDHPHFNRNCPGVWDFSTE